MEKNNLVAAIPKLTKSWSLSIDIKPLGALSGWKNIMHATIWENIGSHGDRTPVLDFLPDSTRMHICSSLMDKISFCFDTQPLPLNVYTNIKVKQESVGDSKYVYSIHVNDTLVLKEDLTELEKVREFENVKFYLSNPWYPPANVVIRNCLFYLKL